MYVHSCCIPMLLCIGTIYTEPLLYIWHHINLCVFLIHILAELLIAIVADLSWGERAVMQARKLVYVKDTKMQNKIYLEKTLCGQLVPFLHCTVAQVKFLVLRKAVLR